MAKKILNVIDTAYRATLEEQDDTVLWLTAALRGAGADAHVLLTGHAVSYAVKAQDASGLRFGPKAQTQPPRLADDLTRLIEKGARVSLVSEDLAERDIRRDEIIDGVRVVERVQLPDILAEFDQVWSW